MGGVFENCQAKERISPELHQRAEITLALVAGSERDAERLLDRIHDLVDGHNEAELTFWEPQILGSSR